MRGGEQPYIPDRISEDAEELEEAGYDVTDIGVKRDEGLMYLKIRHQEKEFETAQVEYSLVENGEDVSREEVLVLPYLKPDFEKEERFAQEIKEELEDQ